MILQRLKWFSFIRKKYERYEDFSLFRFLNSFLLFFHLRMQRFLVPNFWFCKSTDRLYTDRPVCVGTMTPLFWLFLGGSPTASLPETVHLSLWFSGLFCYTQLWACHKCIVLRSPTKPLPKVQCHQTPLLDCSTFLPMNYVKCKKPYSSSLKVAIMKNRRNSQGTGAN